MGRKKLQKLLPKLVSLGLVATLCLTSSSIVGATAESMDSTETVAHTTEPADGTASDAESAKETEAVTGAEGTEETATAENAETTNVAEDNQETEATEEYVSERLTHNYTAVESEYESQGFKDYTGQDLVYKVDAGIVKDAGLAEVVDAPSDYKEYSQDASTKVVAMARTGEKDDPGTTFTIDVPQDGLYWLKVDYKSNDTASILPIAMQMKVDGEYPFYECRNLKFETTWKNPRVNEEDGATGTKTVDDYGNEVVTMPTKVERWESKYIKDSSYRRSDALKLALTAGKHEINFTVDEGVFMLGNLTLVAPVEVKAYDGSSETAKGDALYTLQGENYVYANDSSIHPLTEYDTDLEPYTTSDTELNTIDSDSFGDAGQAVTYKVNIEEEGDYYIAQNYRQSDKTDFPVFVDVAIDGEILNDQFKAYGLAYTTTYTTDTISDKDGNNMVVHLTKGTHTITYTITMDPIRHVMEKLDVIMSQVNDLALEVTKVAGTNKDKYRDLSITRYMPNIVDELNGYADELYALEESCLQYSESDKTVAVMASMRIAAEQLRSLANDPDSIPYRTQELSSSSNSANQYLANTVDNLIKNGIAIDRIYVYQEDASLPGDPNFFQSLWMDIKRFISSFTEQAYSTSGTDPDHLQVWVNRSSQYVQLMQKMANEKFETQDGIDFEVDISIMPDQYKLVLANSTGNAPDVATGINYTIPYELAIRGALADMTQFDDFKEVASVYEPGFFLTGTINDQVYSMPETMNFWVLFYRTDVMEKLGIEITDDMTMQDVIDMLPDLQMRGLNFYYPTAGMITMRNFHGTTPLIVQNDGALYYEDASEGTALGERTSVDGFTELTDLFTVYNMDVNIDNFYQHFRNGDLPIGIADLATYNLLTNAAPELSSSWDITVIPGTEKADGTIDRSTCGCAESSVIFKGDEEREKMAWEFIKWWSSTETQAEFGQNLQIIYGDEYMWNTANVEAFDRLPWKSKDKQIIEDWAKNVVDVARVPGTYLLEREMSNAFNDIAVNGSNEQTRIDKAVKTINREIDRKLEEFGYIDSEGNKLQDYTIPTISSVSKILGRE